VESTVWGGGEDVGDRRNQGTDAGAGSRQGDEERSVVVAHGGASGAGLGDDFGEPQGLGVLRSAVALAPVGLV
jgi:hypothetical protein